MEQKILGVSGKKQSGKNTATNFIVGLELLGLHVVQKGIGVGDKGELLITDLFGDTQFAGHLDLNRTNIEFLAFMEENVNPYVKVYSFADILKREVCIKILGLDEKQCYGTDEDKNSLTNLRWEDMPGVRTEMLPHDYLLQETEKLPGKIRNYYKKLDNTTVYHSSGFMTAREVLQFVGTDIFRKMYGDVWVDALFRQITAENSLFALVCDIRFPNEVLGTQKRGGKVIRLDRDVFEGKDIHDSELALDKNVYNWENFDAVMSNNSMTIEQQNRATYELLREWDWTAELIGVFKEE